MNERVDRLSWKDFFIEVSKLVAKRSPDPHTQVGAVIVKDNKILAFGYNGAPSNFQYDFDWATSMKYDFAVHAELNAIMNAAKIGANVCGGEVYLTLSPCHECMKLLAQAGIKNVYYIDEYSDIDKTKLIAENIPSINLQKL